MSPDTDRSDVGMGPHTYPTSARHRPTTEEHTVSRRHDRNTKRPSRGDRRRRQRRELDRQVRIRSAKAEWWSGGDGAPPIWRAKVAQAIREALR